MDDLTIVVPFYNGQPYFNKLLTSIPNELPVVVVDDHSDEALQPGSAFSKLHPNVVTIRPEEKGYFAGAVNTGIKACKTDVLVLNQDVVLSGTKWLDLLAEHRKSYALIGERIAGEHPAFPSVGYVHGTFMFMRRDAINKAGLLNDKLYPLWGGTAEWQLRICRKGFRSLPVPKIEGFTHARRTGNYGSSITQLLKSDPSKRNIMIRTPPEISVVIPCYNHGIYLEDLVNSLIGGKTSLGEMPGQTFQSFEIIIVNDASNDGTHEIALGLASPWKGIHYVRREKNGGTAAAINSGMQRAHGVYATVMGSDDMRESSGLEELYKAQLAHPDMVIYDDIQRFAYGSRTGVDRMREYNFDTLIYKNQMHVGLLYPIKAWRQVGGYPEAMQYGREDWAFNIALGLAGWCGYHIHNIGYLYRREGQNRTVVNTTPDWHNRFLGQLQGLFPSAYQGRNRPMACCGGRTSQTARTTPKTSMTRRTISRARSNDVGKVGMIQVEYVGGNYGNVIWGGPKVTPSGQTYTFGNNDRNRIKWVDSRDLAYLENLRENGKNIFRRVKAPVITEEKPAEVVPTVEPEPDTIPDLDLGSTTVAILKDYLDTYDFSLAQLVELDRKEADGKDRASAHKVIQEAINAKAG